MKLSEMSLMGQGTCQCCVQLEGPCLSYITDMLWLFLQYIYSWMPKMAQIITEGSCMSSRRIAFNVILWGLYMGHIKAMCWLFLQYLCIQMTEMA